MNTLPSTLEREGPEVIATILDLLYPTPVEDEDEEIARLWPVEAMQ